MIHVLFSLFIVALYTTHLAVCSSVFFGVVSVSNVS
jgi:hypothetical protein